MSDHPVFDLFRGQCARCIILTATDLHHIVPRSQGGTDDDDNLIPLCKECHDFITENGHRKFIRELQELRASGLEFFARRVT